MFNTTFLCRLRHAGTFGFAALIFLSGFRCLAQQDAPSSWQAAADDFTAQILSRASSPSALSVSFANLSSLTMVEQTAVKQAIMTDLRNAGVRLVKPDFAQADVDITFSENWQSYVWIAAIKQGPEARVAIKTVPRPQKSAGARTNAFSIKKNLVRQQDAPMLDFASDGQNLIVLESDQIVLYGNDAGQWRLKQTLAIPRDSPWPRDLRGRLELRGLQVTAFLPGMLCSGSTTPPTLQCRAGDDPWQIEPNGLGAFFSPARNFFTGVLAGSAAGESVGPFFSGGVLQNGNSREWFFAGLDGRGRIFLNDLSSPATIVSDWGSSVVGVQSTCGNGRQVLATAPGDFSRPDSVQAFEIEGRHEDPVSAAIDMDGPVTALWPGDNPQTAHAVVQSTTTQKFEAWSLSVTCI
jgi:hypothetical protein